MVGKTRKWREENVEKAESIYLVCKLYGCSMCNRKGYGLALFFGVMAVGMVCESIKRCY